MATDGCGKSSFIDSIAAALSEDRWVEHAIVGSQDHARQVTNFISQYNKCCNGVDLSTETLQLPTLIDVPGLLDTEPAEQVEKFLRLLMYGHIQNQESALSVYENCNRDWDDLLTTYSTAYDDMKVDRVVFVASAVDDLPGRLMDCVLNAARPRRGAPGYRRREYILDSNYCDDTDPDGVRRESLIPDLDVPILRFLQEVCDRSIQIVNSDDALRSTLKSWMQGFFQRHKQECLAVIVALYGALQVFLLVFVGQSFIKTPDPMSDAKLKALGDSCYEQCLASGTEDTELKKPAQGTSTIEDNTACLDCLKDERESDSSSQKELDKSNTEDQQPDSISPKDLNEETSQDRQPDISQRLLDEHKTQSQQQDISSQEKLDEESIQDPQSEPCSHKQEDSRQDENDPRDPQQDISDQNRSENKSIQDPQSEPCSHKQEDSPEDKNDPRDPQQDSDQNRSDNKSIQDPQSEPCSHKQEDSPEDKNDPRDPQQNISDQNRSDNKSIQDPQSEPCSHKQEDSPEDKNDPRDPQQDSDQNRPDNKSIQDPQSEPCSHKQEDSPEDKNDPRDPQQDISDQNRSDNKSIQDPQSEPCSHKQEDSPEDKNDPRDPQQDISDQNRSDNKSIQDPQSEPCSHKQEDSPEDKNDPRDPQQDSDQNRSDNKSIQDPQSEPCSHKQEDSPQDENDPRDPQQDSDQNRSDNKSIQDPQSEPCSHKQEDSPEDKNDPRDPQQDSDQNRSDNKSIQDPQSEPCSHKDFDQSTLVDSQSKCLSLSQRDTRGGQASSRSEPSGTYRRRDTRWFQERGGRTSFGSSCLHFLAAFPVYNIAPSWNTCPSNPQPVPPLQDDFSSSTETRIQEKMDKRESILKAYLEEKVQRLMLSQLGMLRLGVSDKFVLVLLFLSSFSSAGYVSSMTDSSRPVFDPGDVTSCFCGIELQEEDTKCEGVIQKRHLVATIDQMFT
ncbi:hypothetical protein C0Q70_21745 [Pomacea canaliculata]|uniref:Uncharacterized protein n=1 Tax=Pomacea canaliculata TaxID=400727 RepID=A0A2T7NDC7_POMCA|nr:hypothetical protein C0Q70_21745 [Pomacea canaliculata]